LEELLKQNRHEYHILWNNEKYVNHASHGLIALYKLGASASQLSEYFREYTKRLVPQKEPLGVINESNWMVYRGQGEYYSDFLGFFEKEISIKGLSETLNAYVPHLIEGISGHAFHGAIALGFSLEVPEYPTNAAEGLALWAMTFTSQGSPSTTNKYQAPVEILKKVRGDQAFEVLEKQKMNFLDGMGVLRHAEYQAQLRKYDLGIPEHTAPEKLQQMFLDSMVEAFLKLGASDFFLLHGVTCSKATVNIANQLLSHSARVDAFRYLWRGIVCAYIVQGRPAIQDQVEYNSTQVYWDDIIQMMMQHKDTHLFKLVFVCRNTEKEEKGDKCLFKETAYRAVTTFAKNHDDWHY
jgi:hypothetical protein